MVEMGKSPEFLLSSFGNCQVEKMRALGFPRHMAQVLLLNQAVLGREGTAGDSSTLSAEIEVKGNTKC